MTSPHGSLFYTIPAQVMNDERLEAIEKIIMTYIYGLADEEGKCFPGNEWFEKKLKISIRHIQRYLQHLEELKYIKREIITCVNDPFKKYRIIHVICDFKLSLPNDACVTTDSVAAVTTATTPMSHIINKKELINKKDNPPPPSSKEELMKKMISLGWLKEEFEKAWIKYCQEPEGSITNVKSWLIAVMQSLRLQAARNQDVQQQSISESKKNTTHQDKKLLHTLEKRNDLINKGIVVGYDYIQFASGQDATIQTYFKIGEPKFVEKVTTFLRKIGIVLNNA